MIKKKYTYKYSLALWFLWLSVCSPIAVTQILPFHPYTAQDGLASNWVTSMIQDHRGYLWIGTAEGVSVFNGVTFKNYTVRDGLPFNFVYTILESKFSPGTFWIATGDGLARLKDDKFTTFHTERTFERDIFLSLFEDDTGTLWFGTYHNLYQLRNEQLVPYFKDSFGDASIHIAQTPDHVIWVGGQKGMYSFVPGDRRVNVRYQSSNQFGEAQDLVVDSKGELWAAFNDGKLIHVRKNKDIDSITLPDKLPNRIMEDGDGNLLVGFYLYGVRLFQRSDPTFATSSSFIAGHKQGERVPVPLLKDRENNLWFINPSRGILKLSDKSVLSFPLTIIAAALNNQFAVVDIANHIWIVTGTDFDEVWLDSLSTWHTTTHSLVIRGKNISPSAIAYDNQKFLWIKYTDGGILKYRIETIRDNQSRLILQQEILEGRDYPKSTIECFIVDKKGNCWLSLPDVGVLRIEFHGLSATSSLIDSSRGMADGSNRAMFEDRQGNVWFGGNSHGLGFLSADSVKHGRIHTFTTADGIPDNYIRSITQDSNGDIWIGTRYGGVARYRDKKFEAISVKEGLLSNAVWCFTNGKDSSLWFGTNEGLQYIRHATSRVFVDLHEMKGLQIMSLGMMANGTVWIITPDGLKLFNRNNVNSTHVLPSIYIEKLNFAGKDVDLQSNLEFPHDQNNCTITYAGILFSNPSSLMYQYRFAGGEWSLPNNQRAVTFVSLQPAHYTFEVRAMNGEGEMSLTPAEVSFTITPPFWRKSWFVITSAVVMISGFVFSIRYVSQKKLHEKIRTLEQAQAVQREREQTRERIARDLHDDVASTLGSIALYSESLKKQMSAGIPQGNNLAEKISSLSLEAEDAMSDIIWSTAPEHDSLNDLLTKIKDITSGICTANNLLYEMSMPDRLDETTRLPDDIRKNVYLIFKETINNTVKHSHATAIEVRVRMTNGEFILMVKDNGKGFTMNSDSDQLRPQTTIAHTSHGHGLRNMKKRALDIGASFVIESAPDMGTTMTLSFKMT